MKTNVKIREEQYNQLKNIINFILNRHVIKLTANWLIEYALTDFLLYFHFEVDDTLEIDAENYLINRG